MAKTGAAKYTTVTTMWKASQGHSSQQNLMKAPHAISTFTRIPTKKATIKKAIVVSKSPELYLVSQTIIMHFRFWDLQNLKFVMYR